VSSTKHTFCRICEALCGLEVDVEGERVVAIRPDPRHVASHGFACVKGLHQHHLYDSPDRLMYPLKRVDGRHVRVSWAQALAEIGAKLKALRAGPGPDSIAMYVGTAAGFGVLHPVFASGFMQGLGSKSLYSSATQDCANKFAVAQHVYGFCFTQPFPDLDRTRCLIVVGANPAVSKWSFLQVPAPIAALKDLEARGAQACSWSTRGARRRRRPRASTCSSAPTRTCGSTWRSCTSWCARAGSTGPAWRRICAGSTRCWHWPRRGRRSGRPR
jgi:anaerobic selenocysteine-containing dehydrogenase